MCLTHYRYSINISLFPSLSFLSVFLLLCQYETQFPYTVFLGLSESIAVKWQCNLENKTSRVEVSITMKKYLYIISKLNLRSYLLNFVPSSHHKIKLITSPSLFLLYIFMPIFLYQIVNSLKVETIFFSFKLLCLLNE